LESGSWRPLKGHRAPEHGCVAEEDGERHVRNHGRGVAVASRFGSMTGEEDEELKKENREIGVVAEWGCFLFAYPLADGQMGGSSL